MNPICCAYFLKATELNDGPLSVLRTLGHPNCEITLSRTGMMLFAANDLTISTIGYRECSSVITNRYSHVGRGPQKSALRFSHGPSGISDISNGSFDELLSEVDDWQARQHFTAVSTFSLIRGNHTFDRMKAFVRLIP